MIDLLQYFKALQACSHINDSQHAYFLNSKINNCIPFSDKLYACRAYTIIVRTLTHDYYNNIGPTNNPLFHLYSL